MTEQKKVKISEVIMPENNMDIMPSEAIVVYIDMLLDYIKKKQPKLIHRRYHSPKGYEVIIKKMEK